METKILVAGVKRQQMEETLKEEIRSGVLKPGETLPWDDFAKHMTQTISQSFTFGFKLGSPFIAFTIVFYSGMGLVSRLMPQLNIFFLSLPLQIYLGLGMLFLTVPVIILVFFRYYDDGLYFFTN